MTNERIPLLRDITVCDLSIATACTFRCTMCFFWKPHRFARPVLSAEQWKQCITHLRERVSPNAQLIYSGYGEVLLRDGIEDMLRYGAGDFPVYLNSNAWMIDRRMAGVLSETVSTISLSLDGTAAATHDRIRGVPGAWQRVHEAIGHLRACSRTMRILINTVIMNDNLDEIIPLVEWADAAGLDGVFLQAVAAPNNTPVPLAWQDGPFSYLWPKERGKAVAVVDALLAKKAGGSRIVNTASQLESFKHYFLEPLQAIPGRRCEIDTALKIDPCGGVKFCVYDEPVGYITDASLDDIWRSDAAQRQREKVASCHAACPQLLYCFQNTDDRSSCEVKEGHQ